MPKFTGVRILQLQPNIILKLELSIFKRQTANMASAKADHTRSFISFSKCLWIDLERFVLQETFCS